VTLETKAAFIVTDAKTVDFNMGNGLRVWRNTVIVSLVRIHREQLLIATVLIALHRKGGKACHSEWRDAKFSPMRNPAGIHSLET
jgi:hypothetical protein